MADFPRSRNVYIVTTTYNAVNVSVFCDPTDAEGILLQNWKLDRTDHIQPITNRMQATHC